MLAAFGLLGYGFLPVGQCTYETGEALQKTYNVNDDSALAQRVIRIQVEFETRKEKVPPGQAGRMLAASGECVEEFPLSDATPHLIGFAILLLAAVFFRNQSIITETLDREDRQAARNAMPTPASIQAHSEPKKPRSRDPRRHEVEEGPSAIDVGEGFDLGLGGERGANPDDAEAEKFRDEDEESLMSFVEERREHDLNREAREEEEDKPSAQIQGFYCPPHYANKPAIYVDPNSKAATDKITAGVDPLNNPGRPFQTLEAALKMAAERVVKDLAGVQIRLAPGVYQTSVEVPDRVVLVNHRLPAEGQATARLQWLTGQEVNHPDRVTILPKPEQKVAIRFRTGQNQGVYGCHIVGRESVPQVGIVADGSAHLTIFNCVVEGFTRGGIRLENAGAEMPGQGVNIIGSRIIGNSASKGGGIYALKCALTIRDSMIQRNRAHNGGGIYLDEARGPFMMRRTRLSNNAAQIQNPPDGHPRNLKLNALQTGKGCGGAIWCRDAKMKISASEFVSNKASFAGGAVAAFNVKAVLSSDDEHAVRFKKNQARMGGAIVVNGWQAAQSTLKVDGGEFEQNRAVHAGGALVAIGLAVVQFTDATLLKHSVTDKRATGGALSLHNGAEVIMKGTELRGNTGAQNGGAIAAINATVRLGEKCVLRDNSASSYGGGVFIITEPSEEVEALVSYHEFKLPFIFQTKDCTISKNRSEDLGAGVRAGNFEPRSTFPLGLKIHRTTRLAHNRTKHPDEAGDDIWVSWADEVRANGRDRPGEKLLLK